MKDFKNLRIAVAGTGYVGLSIATLLSQHHHVSAVDVVPELIGAGRLFSSLNANNRISKVLR